MRQQIGLARSSKLSHRGRRHRRVQTGAAHRSFEKDDLVVKVSYYKLEKKDLEGGFRSYSLVAGERMIHVSSMIRLSGLMFSPGPGGPAGRVMRSGVTKLYYFSRESHNSVESCCHE